MDKNNKRYLEDENYPYIDTIYLDDIEYQIYLDDYGQQYFCMFQEFDEVKEVGLGAFNLDYKGAVEDLHGVFSRRREKNDNEHK